MMDLNQLKALVGTNTRYYRERKQLSQIELAHLSDVSETYISELENGKANPCLDTLNKIANSFEAEVEDLFRRR